MMQETEHRFDKRGLLRFGDAEQWGVSVHEGCILFHPDPDGEPMRVTAWLWREAFELVESLGGFEKARGVILSRGKGPILLR